MHEENQITMFQKIIMHCAKLESGVYVQYYQNTLLERKLLQKCLNYVLS